MPKLQKIFTMILHIMVKHNPKKTFYLYIMVAWSIFAWKKYMSRHAQKCNIFQKWLKWLLTFINFIIVISHVLNQICEPLENFDNFHVINGFFKNPSHKYVVNWHFHKKITCKWNVTSVLRWVYFYILNILTIINEIKYHNNLKWQNEFCYIMYI